MIFTFNLISRESNLHRQFLYLIILDKFVKLVNGGSPINKVTMSSFTIFLTFVEIYSMLQVYMYLSLFYEAQISCLENMLVAYTLQNKEPIGLVCSALFSACSVQCAVVEYTGFSL